MLLKHRFQTIIAQKSFGFLLGLAAFIIIMVLGELFVAVQRQDAETRLHINKVAYASAVRARIERELNSLLYLNSGLSSYLVVNNDKLKDDELNDILAVLYRSSRHVRNFGIAEGYRLTYVYPKKGNERAIGLYYPDQTAEWPLIRKVIASGKPALAGPIKLVQGGSGLVYRVPIMICDDYWGLLSTVIDIDSLFKAIADQTQDENFSYALRSHAIAGIESKPLTGDQSLFQQKESVIQEIEIPGGRWSLAVLARSNDLLLTMALVQRLASLLLGSMLGWLLYSLIRNRGELARLVMFDSLTGLPNRRMLQEHFQMAAAHQQRSPKDNLVLLFLDLDGFKKINDTYGHKAGDAVLKATAERVRSMIRTNDTVARWGGYEFIVLLEQVAMPHMKELVRRLREQIESPIIFEGHQLTVGVSIGVEVCPDSGAELDDIIKHADHAMYEDKSVRKSMRC